MEGERTVRLIGKKALSWFLSVSLLLAPLGTRCFAETEIDKGICQKQQETQEKQQNKEILQQIEKDNKVKNNIKKDAMDCLMLSAFYILFSYIFITALTTTDTDLEDFIKNLFKNPRNWLKDRLKFFCSEDGIRTLAFFGFIKIAGTLLSEFSSLCGFIYGKVSNYF